jgi:hypothetical protein
LVSLKVVFDPENFSVMVIPFESVAAVAVHVAKRPWRSSV